MPVYEFEAEDGELREEFFPMAEAPRVGSWIERDGKAYRRVLAMPQIADSKGQTNYRLHSEGCPNKTMVDRWERQAREKGLPLPARAPAYDELGRAVFRSPKELDDYCKKDGRYKVGNRLEVAQEHIRRVDEHKANQLRECAEREKQASLPEVK